MADREAILAALRGARPCSRHADLRPNFPACSGCHEARADAVLAAIQPTLDDLELRYTALKLSRATPLPCGHPASCATTPDNPPHDGSTWTCAWCEEVAALRLQLDRARTDGEIAARQGWCLLLMARGAPPHDAGVSEAAMLDAALRKARADALREAGATCPACAMDPGDPPCPHAERLRRMANDAEAEIKTAP